MLQPAATRQAEACGNSHQTAIGDGANAPGPNVACEPKAFTTPMVLNMEGAFKGGAMPSATRTSGRPNPVRLGSPRFRGCALILRIWNSRSTRIALRALNGPWKSG